MALGKAAVKKRIQRVMMYKITLNVEGMMCPMCEKHATDAVRKACSVSDVTASHKEKKVVITSKEAIGQDTLSDVIASAGYKVTGYTVEEKKKSLFGFGKK